MRSSTRQEAKGQGNRPADQRRQKSLGTSGRKRLALDRNIWGRKAEEARARNLAVMQVVVVGVAAVVNIQYVNKF